MTNERTHNRKAWDHQVEAGNPWTIPVSSKEINEARDGKISVLLTPTILVPSSWMPSIKGAHILCLASGGGQQGPLFAAAGAHVTILDNSPRQLDQDRKVAVRENLVVKTIEGDMRDLSCFPDESFDLVFHPVSNTFIPDVIPVWREAFRVLKPGSCLLSGFDNPVVHIFDADAYDHGHLKVVNQIPYSDIKSLSAEEITHREISGEPLEFGHTLDEQLGGQLSAGFVLVGFYEDRYPAAANDLLGKYTATFIATRALKPGSRLI